MSDPQTPEAWALFLNQVFDQAFGRERHPVSVVEMATLFTARKFPHDPITRIEGGGIPGVEGMLIPDPNGNRDWAIFFNLGVSSRRRIRFTLAHEFGHYLLHRHRYPMGFKCITPEISVYDPQQTRMEHDADTFASHFLMPLHDYREQISPWESVDINMLSFVSRRYGVSLLAAIRQWLRYTEQRAVLVVSRDDHILWSDASLSAKRSGHIFPNFGPAIPIPSQSLASKPNLTTYPRDGVPLPRGTWFKSEETVEMAVFSKQYDFIISLLLLDTRPEDQNTDFLELPAT